MFSCVIFVGLSRIEGYHNIGDPKSNNCQIISIKPSSIPYNVKPLGTRTSTVAIGRVALHLTEFWSKDVIAWFAAIEAQFETQKIISACSHYNYVVTSHNQRTCFIVSDIIFGSEDEQIYDNFKKNLIECNSLTEEPSAEASISQPDW